MNRSPFLLVPLLLGPLVAIEAHSEIYLTDTQATAAIFPGVKFDKSTAKLTQAEMDKIAEASGEKVRSDQVQIWRAKTGEVVIIDQVLGKHEFITFATGLTADGKVKNIEIMEYRETYGGQVRGESWRNQFVGKDKSAPLKLDKDIKNISGATLSSAHITGGVRRILQTYEVVKNRT